MPHNACIVIDQASYHTMLTEKSKPCKVSSNRETIVDWLVSHGANDDNGVVYTKERLLTEPTKVPTKSGKLRSNSVYKGYVDCTCSTNGTNTKIHST